MTLHTINQTKLARGHFSRCAVITVGHPHSIAIEALILLCNDQRCGIVKARTNIDPPPEYT